MRSRSISIFISVTVAFTTVSEAIVADDSASPYAGIVVRNVFGLKPPPPQTPPQVETPPAPKITLTGIYNLGHKRALMLVPVAAKPPAPAKEESYILGEGERDGDIEVLAIDEKAGTVQVKNHGTTQTLDFVNNGAKLPPPAALPIGAVPGQIPVQQPMNAWAPSAPSGAGGVVRIGGSGAAPLAQSGGSGTGFAGGGNASGAAQVQNRLTPDEQTVLIEAQRAKMMDSGDQTYKILPITELTPQLMGNGSTPENSGAPRPF